MISDSDCDSEFDIKIASAGIGLGILAILTKQPMIVVVSIYPTKNNYYK